MGLFHLYFTIGLGYFVHSSRNFNNFSKHKNQTDAFVRGRGFALKPKVFDVKNIQ
jgi:hypothetical protein